MAPTAVLRDSPTMAPAPLVYLIGASGVGKDSLLDYLRHHQDGPRPFVVARRHITRAAHAGGEDHIAVSEEQFQASLDAGEFAMHWDSHGYRYGIDHEQINATQRGIPVIVNGSREYLPEAAGRFPQLLPVLVTVEHDILRDRLLQRGRETLDEIERRLQRAEAMDRNLHHPKLLRFHNDGPIERTGRELLDLLTVP